MADGAEKLTGNIRLTIETFQNLNFSYQIFYNDNISIFEFFSSNICLMSLFVTQVFGLKKRWVKNLRWKRSSVVGQPGGALNLVLAVRLRKYNYNNVRLRKYNCNNVGLGKYK